MHNNAIIARGLSKKYEIGPQQRARSIRDYFTRGGTRPSPGRVDYWALREISFDIPEGSRVGIIGANGAGKSTLLKILSRIVTPSKGTATVRGRVGSLLEVGTGFHPELTGRENVYLSAAILGLPRRELALRFDEIVAFAGVERFLEMPIKHYSSGMSVRLAFSVAAHLNPEILIVDEVLSVGDAAFQKKSLARIQQIAREGRTVLLVSHNMSTLQAICQRLLWLDHGRLKCEGPPNEIIENYFASIGTADQESNLIAVERLPGHKAVIRRVAILDTRGRQTAYAVSGQDLRIRIDYGTHNKLIDPFFGVRIVSPAGANVLWAQSRMEGVTWRDLPAVGSVECRIRGLPLVPGQYFISPGCGEGDHGTDLVERAATIQVVADPTVELSTYPPPDQALVSVRSEWSGSQGDTGTADESLAVS